jgi:hypothetical protein
MKLLTVALSEGPGETAPDDKSSENQKVGIAATPAFEELALRNSPHPRFAPDSYQSPVAGRANYTIFSSLAKSNHLLALPPTG